MTVDLLHLLPDFSTAPFSHILPSLDRNLVTTHDLLTLDAADVAKRATVPPGEVRKLADAVLAELHADLGFGAGRDAALGDATRRNSFLKDAEQSNPRISTLDEGLDDALGGGIPPGYVVEVTGESGAGKTQLLLTLLLSAQLPAPHGLGKSALYISTEAPLATGRLKQLLDTHPRLQSLPDADKPTLDRVLSIQTPDLESQEHIIRYQLPVAIARRHVGLVVLDSVAANYRAEFDQPHTNPTNTTNTTNTQPRSGISMARRSAQLIQLGAFLRHLARTHRIAVVVANQVADRFTPAPPPLTPSNPNPTSTASQNPAQEPTSPTPPAPLLTTPDPLTLDHQQRWFTGWGDNDDDPSASTALKTPSLGLVWTNQLACRIALIKEPVYSTVGVLGDRDRDGDEGSGEVEIRRWRRWCRVVFASWTAPSGGRGRAFEILTEGVRGVVDGEEG